MTTRHPLRAALGLAAVAALALTAGCSGGDPDDGTVELRLMVWADATQAEQYEAELATFEEKNPGVTVALDWMDTSAYSDKLATTFAAGDPDDVMFLNGTWMGEYASRGALADLEAAGVDTSQIDASLLDAARFEDVLYGMPTGMTSIAFVYNRRLVEAAGLTLPDDTTWTWDDFVAFNEEIYTATGGETYGTGFYVPWTPTVSIWARQHGENLYETDGSLGISADTMADYFAMTVELREGNGFPPAGALDDSGSSVAESPLGTGLIASQIIPANTFEDYDSAMDGDLELMRLPGEGEWGETGYQVTPTLMWGMAAATEHPEEATALIDFLTNDVDSFATRSTLLGVPLNSEVAQQVSQGLSEDDQAFVDFVLDLQAQDLKPYYLEPAGAGDVGNILVTLATEVEFGRMTPAEAGAEFVDQAADALAQAAD